MPKKKRYSVLSAVKGRIREKGTSYRKVASELGISTHSLSDKLNGYHDLTATEMEKMAELLEIEPKEVCKFFLPGYCDT